MCYRTSSMSSFKSLFLSFIGFFLVIFFRPNDLCLCSVFVLNNKHYCCLSEGNLRFFLVIFPRLCVCRASLKSTITPRPRPFPLIIIIIIVNLSSSYRRHTHQLTVVIRIRKSVLFFLFFLVTFLFFILWRLTIQFKMFNKKSKRFIL